MNKYKSHWLHAALTFFLTVLAAGVLLPLVRSQLEVVHKYFGGLRDWLRIGSAFFSCVVFTTLMFKLLAPRWQHLAHWPSHPPAWLASFLGWLVVAVLDLAGGLSSNGCRATGWEWLGYGGGSLLLVGWHFGLWQDGLRWFHEDEPQTQVTTSIGLKSIENVPWEEIEQWLRSDAPADCDFLNKRGVADRLARLLSGNCRSIGVVGSFGSGKTTLVNWVTERLASATISNRRCLVCYHSCWGFETSGSAIYDMLGSALAKLSSEIDTFQVDSLPESYRQTFSAGGDWIETISNLVLRIADPMQQFEHLSELLDDIDGTLVFIVEDLDRNETAHFEVQEVVAFLERLKRFRNLKFVLTGGLSSSQRIDYAKLCDHIEYLRSVQPQHSSGLVLRVLERCHDRAVFPHEPIGGSDKQHHWNLLSGLMMRDYEEFSLPQAIAILLDTPRSLRHALGRTYAAWATLYGEIDFNHLFGLNVLRFGAPECFQFLMRRWERLRTNPSRDTSSGQERTHLIREAVIACQRALKGYQ